MQLVSRGTSKADTCNLSAEVQVNNNFQREPGVKNRKQAEHFEGLQEQEELHSKAEHAK